MCTRCGKVGDGERWGDMGRWGGGEVGISLPVHVSTIKDNLGTVCLCVLDTN